MKSIERTAYHEAGHAVLAHFLGVGLKHVSIIANEDSSGHILDGGEFSEEAEEMRHHAEEAFWLCMAIVRYAGAEAERRLTQRRRNTGAKNDYKWAAIALEKITMDWPSRRALYFYARRRARLLVENYWPEIEALARVLMERKELDPDEAEKCFASQSSGAAACLCRIDQDGRALFGRALTVQAGQVFDSFAAEGITRLLGSS